MYFMVGKITKTSWAFWRKNRIWIFHYFNSWSAFGGKIQAVPTSKIICFIHIHSWRLFSVSNGNYIYIMLQVCKTLYMLADRSHSELDTIKRHLCLLIWINLPLNRYIRFLILPKRFEGKGVTYRCVYNYGMLSNLAQCGLPGDSVIQESLSP